MSRYLQDTDPMPFGKYKGTPMGKVPASYLDFLIGMPWISQWPSVEEYITRNLAAIHKEMDDDEHR